MYEHLMLFNEYIKDYDRRIVFFNLKRALLYIFTKCIVLTEENMDKGDMIKLGSTDPNISFYLVLNDKNKYNDPFNKEDSFYSYNYSLYYKVDTNNTFDNKGVELLECTCTDINTVAEIKFKVLPDCYDNFTDEQHFLVNYILKEFVNTATDDDTPYDLFHSLIVDRDDEDVEDDS